MQGELWFRSLLTQGLFKSFTEGSLGSHPETNVVIAIKESIFLIIGLIKFIKLYAIA